ncbi:MAG: phosphoenolpyruvate carboxykinase (ATP) [Cytophagales bacterium]|nr:phosphoenolpyruvate carboxykinase (ATP) [Bernardetiaceae bacterium]MDW8203430.1 phosphoenolpyruvate carboxykinase (ATP) [Cytophagales bacterium]
MQQLQNVSEGLAGLGLKPAKIFYNLPVGELVELALTRGEGQLTDDGALMYDTGKFTGRAPKDRFIVKDAVTADKVWWGDINQPFDPHQFDALLSAMVQWAEGKELFVRDAFAGADEKYRFRIRIIGQQASHNLFCYNMFIRPSKKDLQNFIPDFTVLAFPDFQADPAKFGTRNPNFVVVNFSKKMVIIGGTGYTGETKKSIFSILNFVLPVHYGVLPMHCGANMGKNGDVAVFFGLSGTGKTTLSADPNRFLIGDDEHGWSEKGIFNFEGGCYAKVINLSKENEPDIWHAVRFGALLENTRFFEGTRTVDFSNTSVTENTRVSYPIYFINNALEHSVGGAPRHIFFLTCDAYGILPPIARLNKAQAMYHFLSGYTAKVAGTEHGITEPTAVFSTCFGAPFMPLHPIRYAELLGKKLEENQTTVWLVNTGWTGGPYGVGSRMKLSYTRAMITAAMDGSLEQLPTYPHSIFGVAIPVSCPHVPTHLLNPRDTWADKDAYDAKAQQLAQMFMHNFEKFSELANEEILSGAPKLVVNT